MRLHKEKNENKFNKLYDHSTNTIYATAAIKLSISYTNPVPFRQPKIPHASIHTRCLLITAAASLKLIILVWNISVSLLFSSISRLTRKYIYKAAHWRNENYTQGRYKFCSFSGGRHLNGKVKLWKEKNI